MANDKLLFSKKEAAQMLSVSLRTIDNLIARKQLLTRRVGKRVLVPASSLQQFARRDHPVISGKSNVLSDHSTSGGVQ